MSYEKTRTMRSRATYYVATLPVVGYSLLVCWHRGWLPAPRKHVTAYLRDGRHLRCQLWDRTQRTMYLGLFEPSETRILRELLNPGDTFIDVGAHIGWFTTIASKGVGDSGQVFAFEPYTSNAAILKENLAYNDCTNVRLVQVALGSQPGTLTLARGGEDSGGVTALDWASDGRLEVPVTTLDEAAADVGPITLMKVDVEGWEAHVLRGGARTLARTKYVLIELNRPALVKAKSSPEELFDLLRSAGFAKFLPVVQSGLRRLHRSDVSNVLATRL
jgi:FkbM family methyltransferase